MRPRSAPRRPARRPPPRPAPPSTPPPSPPRRRSPSPRTARLLPSLAPAEQSAARKQRRQIWGRRERERGRLVARPKSFQSPARRHTRFQRRRCFFCRSRWRSRPKAQATLDLLPRRLAFPRRSETPPSPNPSPSHRRLGWSPSGHLRFLQRPQIPSLHRRRISRLSLPRRRRISRLGQLRHQQRSSCGTSQRRSRRRCSLGSSPTTGPQLFVPAVES